MHVSSVLQNESRQSVPDNVQRLRSARSQSDIFAADKELMDIFEKTYGPVKRKSSGQRVEYNSSPKKDDLHKRTSAPKFEGPEYVLVDGYNVIFAWEELNRLSKESLGAARNTLINILCNYRGYKKCELILVFDAYKVKGNTREVEQVGGISIVYTKEAETADMYIEKVTHQIARHHRVRVVTSDRLEQIIILGNGALRISSNAFLEEVRQAEAEIRDILRQKCAE